jgi:acetyl esterase/lipase
MLVLVTAAISAPAAGPLREWSTQRRAATAQQDGGAAPMDLPAGIRVVRDVAYGADPKERFDVYAPEHARAAPVIFLVHGGGWARGDKASPRVVEHKVARWVPRGLIVISVNYPLVPDTNPLQQARDVARALAIAQRDTAQWGGDRNKFILIGHSAGAHLVALISAEPALALTQGAVPWLGTVALDSAAYDVARIMRTRHLRLYDRAFGNDPAEWAATSPTVQLRTRIAPFLAVCSSRRNNSCPQAQRFVDKARSLGARAQTLPEDLSHGQINSRLGLASEYTSHVETFMSSLDPSLARLLAGH